MKDSFKEKINYLKNYAHEKGYLPCKKIIEILNHPDDEVLDKVIAELENEGIEITRATNADAFENADLSLNDDDLDSFLNDLSGGENYISLIKSLIEDINDSNSNVLDNRDYWSEGIVKQYLNDIGRYKLLTPDEEIELSGIIQKGLEAQQKLKKANDLNNNLTSEEKLQLERLVAEGIIARDAFIERNLRLVVSVAKRYVKRGLDFSDLIQEGNLGLINAVNKFDPTKGCRFSTYAYWWIRQAITRALANQGRTIRLPVHMHETINKMYNATEQLTQELKRKPTLEEIANRMKISVEKVQDIIRFAQEPILLDAMGSEDHESSFNDFIIDQNTFTPMQFVENHALKEVFNFILQTLTPREERVIRLRFGLNDNQKRTLDEVGQELGVTRERVRQIENRALKRLRHPTRFRHLVNFRKGSK